MCPAGPFLQVLHSRMHHHGWEWERKETSWLLENLPSTIALTGSRSTESLGSGWRTRAGARSRASSSPIGTIISPAVRSRASTCCRSTRFRSGTAAALTWGSTPTPARTARCSIGLPPMRPTGSAPARCAAWRSSAAFARRSCCCGATTSPGLGVPTSPRSLVCRCCPSRRFVRISSAWWSTWASSTPSTWSRATPISRPTRPSGITRRASPRFASWRPTPCAVCISTAATARFRSSSSTVWTSICISRVTTTRARTRRGGFPRTSVPGIPRNPC